MKNEIPSSWLRIEVEKEMAISMIFRCGARRNENMNGRAKNEKKGKAEEEI